jgi:hypothetical protein
MPLGQRQKMETKRAAFWRCWPIAAALIWNSGGEMALAQQTPDPAASGVLPLGQQVGQPPESLQSVLHLSAVLTASDAQPLRGGLQWRVFDDRTEPDGTHKLVAQSSDANPSIPLPEGNYIVHAAFGLAGATKFVKASGKTVNEKIVLNAGSLRIVGMLGDAPINPLKSSISIYVPERGNSEAKLIVSKTKTGVTIGLPEGNYHIVSTLLDSASNGSVSATNSVVSADLRVQAGKLTDATLRHRAALMTLKLVSGPGSEALANTAFTILTPGGDVIREMIGAFPSLVLAEGEYVVIARHDNKAYQTNFKVVSTLDRDVEVLTQ